MRRVALSFVLLACAVPQARAQGGLVSWNRLDVAARLDNDGRLHVAETHEMELSGDVSIINRTFHYAADQSVLLGGISRLEADGSKKALKDAAVESADSYRVYRWGVQFSVRGERDPAFEGVVTRRYVIEYELQGAITPAWDLPAGRQPLESGTSPRNPLERAREVWSAWREAWPEIDRHYRLDHDVVFPSEGAGGGVRELNYRLEYDTAWVLLDKDRDLGVATPDVDYRVQRVLRYLPAGRPKAVNAEQALFRVSTLAVPLLFGLVLGLLFLLADRVFNPSPRGDRSLFENRVVSLPPELIREQLGGPSSPPSFESFLLRMAAQKKIAISVVSPATDEAEAVVSLRLTTDRARLTPFEADVVGEIFGRLDTISTTDIQARFRGRNFHPNGIVSAAFARLRAPAATRPRKGRPLLSAAHLSFMAAGVAFMVKSLTDRTMDDPLPLLAGLVPGNILVTLWPVGSAARRPGLLAVLIGMFGLGVLGAALALSPNTPLSGAAALGLTVLSTGHCLGLIARLPKAGPTDLELDAARRWAMAELRRPRPDLRDAWVDSLEAIGASRALARWKARHAGSFEGGDMSDMTSTPVGPPFTGEAPRPPTLPGGWIYGFSVDEGDDEEDEDGEEPE